MKVIFDDGPAGKLVYCKRCGQIAGEPTSCPGYSVGHDFASTSVHVLCERCGAVPGKPTKCPGYSVGHNFQSIPDE